MRSTVFHVFLALFFANLLLILLVRLWQGRAGARIWSTVLFAGWAFGTYGLLMLAVLAPYSWHDAMRRWFYPAFSTAMVWNFLLLAPFVLIASSVALLTGLWARLRGRPPASPARAETGLSRRAFLYELGLGVAPAVALGAGLHGTLTQEDLRLKDYTVPIADLPPELEGLVIAHVSDIHTGLYCGEKRLRLITDATNDLKADLVLVSGDVINDSVHDLPPAMAALLRLRARYGPGPILCEGNHDLIPGAEVFADACAQSRITLLRGTEWSGKIRGAKVRIAGLPWMDPHFQNNLATNLDPFPETRKEPELRVSLVHHPDLFPQLVSSSDLVLSGHTHGGQIMLGPIGFGPLLFNYWSGLYRSGQGTMIVSNGCGDWFPCRIGAPAEIGRLTLKRA